MRALNEALKTDISIKGHVLQENGLPMVLSVFSVIADKYVT